jgi:glucokinase
MSIYITVDLGGTRLRAASYPPQGLEAIEVKRVPSQGPETRPQNQLVQLIKEICPQGEEIAAISVAAPGPLNPKTGLIYMAPNIPAFKDFPIVAFLGEHFQVPILLDNDANLAAVGEWKVGAGKGHEHLIYLTVSTGIGSGVISDGRLLHGAGGIAAELGHINVIPEGPLCGCGQYGHLEALASGTAIARWTQEQINAGAQSVLAQAERISAKTIAEAARQGDTLAQEAYTRAGTFIGLALADFLHTFNPTIVIFGGGVSKSWDLLGGPTRKSMEKHVLSPIYLQDLTITTAALGDDAGLIGALLVARDAVAGG